MTKISSFQRAAEILKRAEDSVGQRIPPSFKMTASEVADSMYGDKPMFVFVSCAFVGWFGSIFGTAALLSTLPNVPTDVGALASFGAGVANYLATQYIHTRLDKLAEPSRKKRGAKISCCDRFNTPCESCSL